MKAGKRDLFFHSLCIQKGGDAHESTNMGKGYVYIWKYDTNLSHKIFSYFHINHYITTRIIIQIKKSGACLNDSRPTKNQQLCN